MLIKAGDSVQVIAGADKGVRSTVTKINRASGKAIVEGVAKVYKHVKRSQKNPQGGRLSTEMPVQLSNLMFYCDSCSKPVRLGTRFLADGTKERYCKKCDTSQGEIAPARSGHSAKA